MKITVLGAAGRMGSMRARHLIDMGHEVHGIDLQEWPADLKMPRVTWTALLDMDAVVIATPAENHLHALNRAVTQCKHAFVEKPLCLIGQTKQMRETLNTAALRSLVVAVGYNLRFHPAVMQVKDQITSGALRPMWGSFLLRQKPQRPLAHFLEEWASHEMDLAMHLLGDADHHHMIRYTHGVSGYFPGGPQKEFDHELKIAIHHEDGIASFIHADAMTDPPRRAFTLVDQDGRSVTCDIETDHVQEEHYRRELERWIWEIQREPHDRGDDRLATGDDGLAVIELLEGLTK